MFSLPLFGAVGPGLENDEDDIKAIASNLWSLGYSGASEAAETGLWNDALEHDLRAYQREQGLTVDGFARPGGETENALNGSQFDSDSAAEARTAPPPQRNLPTRGPTEAAGTDPLERLKEMRDAAARPFNLLDPLPTPKRFDPFAIARANAGRERSLLDDADADDTARREPLNALLGDNPLTGKPFRLQPIGPAANNDAAPAAQRSAGPVASSFIPKLA